jgi:glycerol-3-phosphate dehydrogenase (NAD+)
MGQEKIAIIGSGNWLVWYLACIGQKLIYRGSAIARIAAQNAKKHSDVFEERTPIWVFEEDVSGLPIRLRAG